MTEQVVIVGDNWRTGPTATDITELDGQDLAVLVVTGSEEATAEATRRAAGD